MFGGGGEVGAAQGECDSARHEVVASQPCRDQLRKGVDDGARVLVRGHVAGSGGAVADALGDADGVVESDFVVAFAAGGVRHLFADDAELGAEHTAVGFGEPPYGAYAERFQLGGGGSAYHDERGGRHIAYLVHVALAREEHGGVGFFEVAAELGEHFCEGYADGDGEPGGTRCRSKRPACLCGHIRRNAEAGRQCPGTCASPPRWARRW